MIITNRYTKDYTLLSIWTWDINAEEKDYGIKKDCNIIRLIRGINNTLSIPDMGKYVKAVEVRIEQINRLK